MVLMAVWGFCIRWCGSVSASGGGGWRRWSAEAMAVVRAVVDLVAQVMVEMAV